MSRSRISCINMIILSLVILGGTASAQEEWVFYGDTIVYEYPPEGRGPAPETLVVLYTQSNQTTPWQPVPDWWESIWDIDLVTPFSITKYFKEVSYGASLIDAYPRAHWTGEWHYCFLVDAAVPTHQHVGWPTYCDSAIKAADPHVDFAQYAVEGQDVYVVVIVCAPGGASGIFFGGYRRPTNDTFPNGDTVYVRIHYGYRCDTWYQNAHIRVNIHEYGHNWLPDIYRNYYEMGSFCGHYGHGFCQYHAWVDCIPSPINPQWRYEIKDKNTLQPWLVPTEITETQLNYPIIAMQETYNGEAIRIKVAASEQMLNEQSFILTNHQSLVSYEENFPDSGLLIWHVRYTSALGSWSYNRRDRKIDVECAHELWQWDSTEVGGTWSWWPTTPDPIYGTDSLDMFNRSFPPHGQGVYPPITSPEWKGFGSATCMWDPKTYDRFDAFTNPSSNLYDKWHGPLYPEHIHPHFALRDFHPDPLDETIVRADILLNYVQSDVATATSYNNSRKIVSDVDGNIYVVYEAGGYVYFTSAHVSTMRWEPAYPVGKGKAPTIALDVNNVPNIVWVRADTLFWAKRQNYYTWPREVLYHSPGSSFDCETPSFDFDNSGYGHIVLEKWMYDEDRSGLYYGRLNPAQPGSISWELVDSCSGGARCQFPSIAVDNDNDPHVVWQKQEEIYYCERHVEQQEPPWGKIENISNSADHASRTPSVEIAANWVHVVWVEQPWFYNYSNVCHRRCDLSTGRWYKMDWVSNSQSYSESPQTICGDQVVWSEEHVAGNYEIYHSTWDYSLSNWGEPENISNTARNSTAPQIAEVEDEASPVEERYLVTVWCEDDGVLYEVRNYTKPLLERKVKYYIDFGREVQSPYTQKRDGYISYGIEDYKNVDYGQYNIEYHLTGFNSEKRYPIKCMFYHESNINLTLQIRIDDVLFSAVPIPPNQLVTREGIIPEILILDGEITVNNVVMQGGPGVLSSAVIYEMRRPQTGGPQTLLDIEKPSSMIIIRPSITSGDAQITYQLGRPDWITISVFDVTGRRLKTLARGYQPAGSYQLCWDSTDEGGRRTGNGIYFIHLEAGKEIIARKVVIAK